MAKHQSNSERPADSRMKEVNQSEFYRRIGPLNVHPRGVSAAAVGAYPYTSEFVDPYGKVYGKIVETQVGNRYPPDKHYFVLNY